MAKINLAEYSCICSFFVWFVEDPCGLRALGTCINGSGYTEHKKKGVEELVDATTKHLRMTAQDTHLVTVTANH